MRLLSRHLGQRRAEKGGGPQGDRALAELYMYGYTWGKEQLARDLGFKNAETLSLWAGMNKHLWGNEYGHRLFTSSTAYGCTKTSITLGKVIEHWLGVAKRVEAAYEYEYEAAVVQGEAVPV